MKHLLAIVATLLVTVTTHADTIRLRSGQSITGQVLGYSNSAFQVQDIHGAATTINSVNVDTIIFEKGGASAILETRTKGKLEGKVSQYEKAAFLFKNAQGASEQIPAMLVTSAGFNGASSGGEGDNAPAVKVITHGSQVDLIKHLVPGKVTIIDFYADWCGPCRAASPILERMTKDDAGVVLRKVDIVNWGSAVAKQFNIRSIPHIKVYDGTGKIVYEGGFSPEIAKQAVAKAKGKPEDNRSQPSVKKRVRYNHLSSPFEHTPNRRRGTLTGML